MTTTTVKPTVRELREQAGMSIADLEEVTKLSGSGIRQVESGRYGVNVETATRIANAFGLSVNDIDWQSGISVMGRPPLSGVPCNTGPIRQVETCTSCFTQKSASGDCAC